VARLVDGLEVSYLEQPCPAGDLLGTARLRRHSGVPIVLDESVGGPADLRLAEAVGAVDGVNVKPARLGGLDAAAELVQLAVDAGLSVLCGGMVELGIGRAAAAAVAALEGCGWPTDLGPSSAYVAADDELTDPVRCDEDGRLIVPDGIGLGVAVRLERIEAAALAHARLAAGAGA
jgi:O-succinylbenzoate synthase